MMYVYHPQCLPSAHHASPIWLEEVEVHRINFALGFFRRNKMDQWNFQHIFANIVCQIGCTDLLTSKLSLLSDIGLSLINEYF